MERLAALPAVPIAAVGPLSGLRNERHEVSRSPTSSKWTAASVCCSFCATCDDHFQPEWFRLCPSCGHDYGDGVEVERPAGPKEPLNARTWLVLAGLLAGCAVVVAYLLWLFNQ